MAVHRRPYRTGTSGSAIRSYRAARVSCGAFARHEPPEATRAVAAGELVRVASSVLARTVAFRGAFDGTSPTRAKQQTRLGLARPPA